MVSFPKQFRGTNILIEVKPWETGISIEHSSLGTISSLEELTLRFHGAQIAKLRLMEAADDPNNIAYDFSCKDALIKIWKECLAIELQRYEEAGEIELEFDGAFIESDTFVISQSSKKLATIRISRAVEQI